MHDGRSMAAAQGKRRRPDGMRYAIAFFQSALTLGAALGALTLSAPAAHAQANPPTNPYHGSGYVTFVDPDRQLIGFKDSQGTTYKVDTYAAHIDVPAL